MRPKRMLRKARPIHGVAGGLLLAIPGSAVALTAGQAHGQSAIQINLSAGRVLYGERVKISGSTSAADAGQLLNLEFARVGGSTWRALSSTKVRGDGSFNMTAPMLQSGLLRVVESRAGGVRATASAGTGGSSPVAASAVRPVSVGAVFDVPARSINVLGGRPAHVRGTLLPGVSGRRVTLFGRTGRRWGTLASARTGSRGAFDLRLNPGGTGHQWLRIRFDGDRLNTRSWARAGQVTAFRPGGASWYGDGGSTACGFHAFYGVANRTLPCGTKVTFYYGGRTVNAVVDDRGPFVSGRDWDLNQNSAGALGFGGVGTVWSSI